jgi:sugar phosphate isomerase/epimerase
MIHIPSTRLFLIIAALAFFGCRTAPATPIPDEYKIGGFAVGCQAYTFKNFSVLEAIEKTAQAGGRIIELFPNQRFSPETGAAKFDHNAPEEHVRQVKEQLAKHDVRAVNYGVVAGKDDAEWRRIFEFAKKMEMYGITTEAVKDLDVLEKLAKEFDLVVGIHHHAQRPNNPEYKLWDPNYILSLVKDRDRRVGACADTGHWATSGVEPLDAIKILRGRVVSMHLKDRAVIGERTRDIPFGTGVLKIGAILDELKQQGFVGNISIEYEANWDHSVPEVAQCIGFFNGYAACAR